MVSLARFLVAAASTLFGLPIAFASDSFTTAKPKFLCTEVTVSTPKTTSNFTRTDKGPNKESLFQGGFPGHNGTNPTVSVVFGPSFDDNTFTAKIHSAVDFQNISIAYTKRDEVEQVQPYKAYYAVKPKEFCAVTGSEKWKEIVVVSTFREAVPAASGFRASTNAPPHGARRGEDRDSVAKGEDPVRQLACFPTDSHTHLSDGLSETMTDRTTSTLGTAAAMAAGDEELTVHTGNTSESGFDGALDDGGAAATGKHPGTAAPLSRPTAQGTPSNGMPSSALTQASLGREIEGLVLFDLTTKQGARAAFSPHCLKTILDLKLLGIGYDRQRLTFHEIRSSLAARVGENVTVPTLELADGSHLTDSWVIAQYLSEKHPKGNMLFPSPNTSRPFARMVEGFSKFALAPSIGPLTRVIMSGHLDVDSKSYFENVKVGKAKMDRFRAMSSSDKEKIIDACATALEPIEAALAVAKDESSGRQVWLEAGAHPTHADFVLYGWYVFSRVAGPAVTKAIWHSHPAVAKWVHDMDDWAGPEITGDYF